MKKVFENIQRVAETDSTVLITGETALVRKSSPWPFTTSVSGRIKSWSKSIVLVYPLV